VENEKEGEIESEPSINSGELELECSEGLISSLGYNSHVFANHSSNGEASPAKSTRSKRKVDDLVLPGSRRKSQTI
jgi:hypothetical protein